MRKLTYLVATTADGYIAGPDGGDPTGPDGFFDVPPDYIEHLVTTMPEILPTHVRAALGVTDPGTTFDTVVMGRRTYEPGPAIGVHDPYAHLRTVVFSRTLTEAADLSGSAADIEFTAADPVTRVRQLKAEPGKGIWLAGGAALAGQLHDEIDELVLKINPVTIRSGLPVFEGEFLATKLVLTDHHVLASGTIFASYRRAQ